MNSAFDPPRKRGWLKIELQRALAESDKPHAAQVYCPPRDKTISLDECAACSHCTGCVIDSGAKEWQIRCERALSAHDASEPARAHGSTGDSSEAPLKGDPDG